MHLHQPISDLLHFGDFPGFMLRIILLLTLLLVAPFLAGCRRSDPPPEHAAAASSASAAPLTLSSASLQDGKFPKPFTCDGEDKSPALAWTTPPSGTKSLVLTVTDPDAPDGIFTHWILYNLPAGNSALPPDIPRQDELADGARQGRNDFSKTGYGGPCPPHGSNHRYFFDLFALDTNLNVPAQATRAQLEDAMNTHVLARGKLVARYGR